MIYEFRNPPGQLGECVETIFYLSDYTPEHELERLVPDARVSLVIELDGQNRWLADNETQAPIQECKFGWLSGPFRNYISISALPNTELIAARFQRAGGVPLLGRPVNEICDRVVDACDLLGDSIFELRNEILQQHTAESKLDQLQNWLQKNLNFEAAAPKPIQDSISAIEANPTLRKLTSIIETSGYSRKHFGQLFAKYVGLMPKEFQRILRFNQAVAQIHQAKQISWPEISYDCGYFDQPHFIKEFKKFSGINPTEFMQVSENRENFIPIKSRETDLDK